MVADGDGVSTQRWRHRWIRIPPLPLFRPGERPFGLRRPVRRGLSPLPRRKPVKRLQTLSSNWWPGEPPGYSQEAHRAGSRPRRRPNLYRHHSWSMPWPSVCGTARRRACRSISTGPSTVAHRRRRWLTARRRPPASSGWWSGHRHPSLLALHRHRCRAGLGPAGRSRSALPAAGFSALCHLPPAARRAGAEDIARIGLPPIWPRSPSNTPQTQVELGGRPASTTSPDSATAAISGLRPRSGWPGRSATAANCPC